MTEAKLFEAIRELLDLYQWRWVHHYNSQRSNPGFPDITAVRGPRLLFIELKGVDTQGRPGQVSKDQQAWLAALLAVRGTTTSRLGNELNPGVEVYLWRPEHWLNNTIYEAIKPDEDLG